MIRRSLLSLILLFSASSHAITLLEDGNETKPLGNTFFKMAHTGKEFKDLRKVGIGADVGGAAGILGTNLEINFSNTTAFSLGFGFAKEYQTFNVRLKRSLGGETFIPYFAGGFGRWYTTSHAKHLDETNPSLLGDKFLSDKEKRDGEFNQILLYPAFGLQYVQLAGDWAGLSLYAEVQFLISIDDLVGAPTAQVGTVYYF